MRRLASICAFGFGVWTLQPISVAALPATAHFASPQSGDVRVWVNRSSGVYHCPGTRYHGATKFGEYMPESEARKTGVRPAYGRRCGPLSPSTGEERPSGPPMPLLPVNREQSPQRGSGTRVWVNRKSGVFHCPGSRYYGTTKSGVYMTEAAATSAGNRPAYGKSCS